MEMGICNVKMFRQKNILSNTAVSNTTLTDKSAMEEWERQRNKVVHRREVEPC